MNQSIKSLYQALAFVAEAEQAMQKEDWDAAQDFCQMAAQKYAENPMSYLRGAQAARSAGNYQGADTFAKAGLGIFPDNVELWNTYTENAVAAESWPEALKCWRQMIDKLPWYRNAYLNAAKAALKIGLLAHAEEFYEICIDKFVPHVPTLAAYAQVAHDNKDWQLALERWQNLLAVSPDYSSGYLMAAEAAIHLEDYESADKICSSGLSFFPGDTHILKLRAEIAVAQKDWPACQKRWRDVLKETPEIFQPGQV